MRAGTRQAAASPCCQPALRKPAAYLALRKPAIDRPGSPSLPALRIWPKPARCTGRRLSRAASNCSASVSLAAHLTYRAAHGPAPHAPQHNAHRKARRILRARTAHTTGQHTQVGHRISCQPTEFCAPVRLAPLFPSPFQQGWRLKPCARRSLYWRRRVPVPRQQLMAAVQVRVLARTQACASTPHAPRAHGRRCTTRSPRPTQPVSLQRHGPATARQSARHKIAPRPISPPQQSTPHGFCQLKT